jgi:hypothetical protein
MSVLSQHFAMVPKKSKPQKDGNDPPRKKPRHPARTPGFGGKRAERHATDMISVSVDPPVKPLLQRLAWENGFGTKNRPNLSAFIRKSIDFYIEKGPVKMTPELEKELKQLDVRYVADQSGE